MKSNLPIIIIGAGPIGIAAAANLHQRGLPFLLLERGSTAGSAMLEWGHVSLFTTWRNVIDLATVTLLERTGWVMPDPDTLPTGKDIVTQYLIPAAATQALRSSIAYESTVVGVSKLAHSKTSTKDREQAPFSVHYQTSDGEHHVVYARAVIDSSGTWYNPNPAGLDGLPVPGEQENRDKIAYGIPDALNQDKSDYDGQRTLVLGDGHSAMNIILELMVLRNSNPDTQIIWGMRSNNIEKLTGVGINSRLPARAKLGHDASNAIKTGDIELLVPLQVSRICKKETGLELQIIIDGQEKIIEVDRIVVSTGFRPDLDIVREIRLDIDEVVEAPTLLAPIIDPNIHFCGSVKPHGADVLQHHDKGFYLVGINDSRCD